MKYIDKLLQGEKVEWKTLGEVCGITNNKRKPIRADNRISGDIPYYGANNIQDYVEGYTHDGEYILIAEDGSKSLENYSIQYVNGRFWANNHIHIITGEEKLNNRFLYHWLSQYDFKPFLNGGDRAKLTTANLKKILIPIPPLPVQQEIAKILDKFSTLTAELQAELQARKSQYEYYRNKLLTYPMDEYDRLSLRSSGSYSSITKSNHSSQPQSESDLHTNNSVWQQRGKVEWKTLGEIALKTENIKWKETDKTYQYIDLTSVSRENNSIIETIEINKDSAPSRAQKIVEKDDIIFATTRPTQMRLALIADDYHGQIASTGYCVLRVNQKEVLPKWIFFCLTAIDFKDYLEENQSGSAYPAISDSKLKEYKIPLPPIEEQKRIADILDKFDTLVNSISEGLPKEIEFRRKQYEYYRNELLSFPVA